MGLATELEKVRKQWRKAGTFFSMKAGEIENVVHGAVSISTLTRLITVFWLQRKLVILEVSKCATELSKAFLEVRKGSGTS